MVIRMAYLRARLRTSLSRTRLGTRRLSRRKLVLLLLLLISSPDLRGLSLSAKDGDCMVLYEPVWQQMILDIIHLGLTPLVLIMIGKLVYCGCFRGCFRLGWVSTKPGKKCTR